MASLGVLGRIAFAAGMTLALGAFGRKVGFGSPGFALLAAFCVLGLIDLLMPLFSIRMPARLRGLRPWEARTGVYRAIGVTRFGTMLRRTPLRYLNRRVYLAAAAADLPALRIQLENAEAGHFWGGAVTIPYLVGVMSQSAWVTAVSVALFDLFVNVYPLLHLRHVRGRVERVLRLRRGD